jgi:hypothetical protein
LGAENLEYPRELAQRHADIESGRASAWLRRRSAWKKRLNSDGVRASEVILHERAWPALAATRGADTRRLLARLDEVKAEPFRWGDFQQLDSSGRINEVVLLGDWLLTFWSDHAAAHNPRGGPGTRRRLICAAAVLVALARREFRIRSVTSGHRENWTGPEAAGSSTGP